MIVDARIDSPTLTAITISPFQDEGEDHAALSFIPMEAERNEDQRLTGVAAVLVLTIHREDWIFGAITQAFLATKEPGPADKSAETTWIDHVTNQRCEEVVNILWDVAVAGWKSTLGLMKFFPLEVPSEIPADLQISIIQDGQED